MLDVLYEDNHLLAINKRALLATMGAGAGEPSLVNEAKEYLKSKYDKPGNVYLGVVSRLDSFVTGVVLFARTSKAASRLTAQFQSRSVEKTYQALIPQGLRPESAELVHWIKKLDSQRRMVVCRPDDRQGKEARLRYRTLDHIGDYSMLEIELLTGRKHQIRLQLSHTGFPIIGDQKYASDQPFPQGIALHSYQLRFEHPVQKFPVVIEADVPYYWPRGTGP
ncbi:MAG: RluA family pseudouridine synthase [Planctomycetales bacterium]|nr:RluA family pseudouridine synthase [Planctomycetales bacterium]